MRRDPLGGWGAGAGRPGRARPARRQRPLARNGLQPDDAHSRVAAVPGSWGSMGARVNADRRGEWRSTVPLRSRADCGFCQAGSDLGGLRSTELPACSGRYGRHGFKDKLSNEIPDRSLRLQLHHEGVRAHERAGEDAARQA
jgi:hypothetical protein